MRTSDVLAGLARRLSSYRTFTARRAARMTTAAAGVLLLISSLAPTAPAFAADTSAVSEDLPRTVRVGFFRFPWWDRVSFSPKTIRSTMGSIYRMPFVYVEDLGKGIQDLKDKGITTYAAHLEGTNSYDEEDLTNPCAFLIGNEGNGLRREIADMADCYVKIPMLGQVESLNAAIASSVLMFEAARQRRKV